MQSEKNKENKIFLIKLSNLLSHLLLCVMVYYINYLTLYVMKHYTKILIIYINIL